MTRASLAALVAVALFANAAQAALVSTASNPLGASTVNYVADDNDATGDTYSNAIAGFSTSGAAFLTDASPYTATFPGTESMGLALGGENVNVTGSSTPGVGEEVFTFEWVADGFANLIPPGSTISGDPVTTISFEMGEGNAGDDPLEWTPATPFTFNHPEDPMNPGTFLADFDLLGAGGSIVFSGNFFVTPNGDGFSGVVFISAGGADLSGFEISGGRASVAIVKVPEPNAGLLTGLGSLLSLALLRRKW